MNTHVHKGRENGKYPVTICLEIGAAHTLAMWLEAAGKLTQLPVELSHLRKILDAKLVGDPTGRQYLDTQGDEANFCGKLSFDMGYLAGLTQAKAVVDYDFNTGKDPVAAIATMVETAQKNLEKP